MLPVAADYPPLLCKCGTWSVPCQSELLCASSDDKPLATTLQQKQGNVDRTLPRMLSQPGSLFRYRMARVALFRSRVLMETTVAEKPCLMTRATNLEGHLAENPLRLHLERKLRLDQLIGRPDHLRSHERQTRD